MVILLHLKAPYNNDAIFVKKPMWIYHHRTDRVYASEAVGRQHPLSRWKLCYCYEDNGDATEFHLNYSYGMLGRAQKVINIFQLLSLDPKIALFACSIQGCQSCTPLFTRRADAVVRKLSKHLSENSCYSCCCCCCCC